MALDLDTLIRGLRDHASFAKLDIDVDIPARGETAAKSVDRLICLDNKREVALIALARNGRCAIHAKCLESGEEFASVDLIVSDDEECRALLLPVIVRMARGRENR